MRVGARSCLFVVALGGLALGALILAEIALQLASLGSPAVARVLAPPWQTQSPAETAMVPDERLILRGNPRYPGHDAAGYRNPRRLAEADIVTLGDSQTYGTSVRGEEAWPARLAHLTGRAVYNMALGGYGPGQYFLQAEEALALHPRHLIVAIYFGNDLFDAYLMSQRHAMLAAMAPAPLRQAAEALERARPLEPELTRLFETTFNPAPLDAERSEGLGIRRWVSAHVKLWGLARAVKLRLASRHDTLLAPDFAAAAQALSPRQRDYAFPFDGGGWRTILTAPYRLRAVDVDDARIRMGLVVSQALLRGTVDRCRAAGVDLLVVFLPTKESVFWTRVSDGERYPGLGELVEREERVKRDLIASVTAADGRYLDVLDPLRRAPSQPYFVNADGHPNPLGHEVIARAVAHTMKP